MQTHFKQEELMDPPFTEKRTAVDEVDSKMDYVEHQFVQRYGGDHDVRWRTALKESEGIEETAQRAVWNEPEHDQFHIAHTAGGSLVRLLLERDIKHVTSEKKSSLTPTTLTSQST